MAFAPIDPVKRQRAADLLAAGLSTRKIAVETGLSQKTVSRIGRSQALTQVPAVSPAANEGESIQAGQLRSPHQGKPRPGAVPDAEWPGMYRVQLPSGALSDMVNLSRANDFARSLDRAQ